MLAVIQTLDRLLTMNSTKEIITKGNSAVVINSKDGYVFANLYVNARNGIDRADIAGISWIGSTLAGARRWAGRQLAAQALLK